jgi:hypothetical protein
MTLYSAIIPLAICKYFIGIFDEIKKTSGQQHGDGAAVFSQFHVVV